MGWDELTQIYRSKGIVLVLGAGVSFGSNFPSWEGLLSKLEADCLGKDGEKATRRLRQVGYSLPAVASILKQQWVKRERRKPGRTATSRIQQQLDFAELVRKSLYENFRFFPGGVDKANRREIVREIKTTNQTLRAVASLCAVKHSGESVFSRNRLIHAIVTFNLDAVLQAYVYARYEKRLLRTVERPSAGRSVDKINIYHMHGFLRFDSKAGNFEKEAPDSLVLTEEEYYDFFNQPTSIFNYTLLYLLREYSCLFIGLSMSDDNLRRLLHYSKSERIRGYEAEGIDNPSERKIVRHYAIMARSDSRFCDRITQEALKNLGVKVLWIDGFEQIPERLGSLYGPNNWQRVF